MSRYADLRWKIADLEKKIEEEKIINRRLNEDLRIKYYEIHAKENEIEQLKTIIEKIKPVDGKGEE